MIIRKCLVCKYEDKWKDDEDEDSLRASCLPCGHQGLFKIVKNVGGVIK